VWKEASCLKNAEIMTIDFGVQRMIRQLAGISQKDFVEVLSRFHREQ
jgi:hypothetical protein